MRILKRLKDWIQGDYSEIKEEISDYSDIFLSKDIKTNLSNFKKIFDRCDDLIYRKLTFTDHHQNSIAATLIFVDGMIDSSIVNENIILPINHYYLKTRKSIFSSRSLLDTISELVNINEIKTIHNFDDIIHDVLLGNTILFVDGYDKALSFNTKGWQSRSVSTPEIEPSIRGPRDSFVEDLKTNTALIRKRLKDPALKIKQMKIGSRSRTDVVVIYMEDIVHQDVLHYTFDRLQNIEIDSLLDSGYIEQYIERFPLALFPETVVTERPDRVCGNLVEGKICILVDGSPHALIFPITLFQLFQAPSDYHERPINSNLVRMVRYLGFFVATSFPAIYIALINFHHELLPVILIFGVTRARAGVPFPAVVEVLLMEFAIELLREASTRLPGTIAQTVGIVGAIIIGDAAIRAQIVSPTMVIVIAVTVLASYVFPHYITTYPIRLIRLLMIVMASIFGALGIAVTWTWVIGHLCSIHSFGYPYMTPYAPFNASDIKDTLARGHLWNFKTRPETAKKKNRNRWE